MEREEMYELSKKYTLFTWTKQEGYDPICVDRAEGVYFWDKDGTRYTDLSSQLVNVNLGFHNEHVIRAIQEQAEKFCYVAPRHTFEARARLGQMLIEEIAPDNMAKVLFTNGGALRAVSGSSGFC